MIKRRLILVGIEERLLWQLTRILSSVEDLIEYSCAEDLEEVAKILKEDNIDLVVVNSAEDGVGLSEFLCHHGITLPRLLVLTEEAYHSLPQEILLPDDTLFLEKPFNPKEFPFFILKALQEPPREKIPEEGPYRAEIGEPSLKEEWISVDSESEFYRYFNKGFECLSTGDLIGARDNWLKASSIIPDNKRVKANLTRLERMLENQKK